MGDEHPTKRVDQIEVLKELFAHHELVVKVEIGGLREELAAFQANATKRLDGIETWKDGLQIRLSSHSDADKLAEKKNVDQDATIKRLEEKMEGGLAILGELKAVKAHPLARRLAYLLGAIAVVGLGLVYEKLKSFADRPVAPPQVQVVMVPASSSARSPSPPASW